MSYLVIYENNNHPELGGGEYFGTYGTHSEMLEDVKKELKNRDVSVIKIFEIKRELELKPIEIVKDYDIVEKE